MLTVRSRHLTYLIVAAGLMVVTARVASVAMAQCPLELQPGLGITGACYGPVHASIVFDDGSGPAYYVAGYFEFIDTIECRSLARWDGATWSCVGGGVDGTVRELAVYNGRLYVAGSFQTAGDTPVRNIASWDGATWDALDGGVNGSGVNELLIRNGELIVAGGFNAAGPVTAPNIASWNVSGWRPIGDDSAYATTGVIDSLAAEGDNLIAAGDWIARWDGTSWTALPDTGVVRHYTQVVHNDEVYIGAWLSGSPPHAVAHWNGAAWVRLGTVPGGGYSGNVQNLVSRDGDLYVSMGTGGWYRWDGTAWRSAGLPSAGVDVKIARRGFSGEVEELLATDEYLYAAGAFSIAGGTPAENIAAFDGQRWHPLGAGVGPFEWAYPIRMSQSGTDLIVAGVFTQAGGTAVRNVARWDGSTWSALGEGIGTPILALTTYNGDIIAAASNIRRWNGATWDFLTDSVSNYVLALVEYDGDLLAGGSLSEINGTPIRGIARWDGVSWTQFGDGLIGGVNALLVFDGDLYAGGHFGVTKDVTAGVMRWNGVSWTPLGDESLFSGGVDSLAIHNGALVANGEARWTGTEWVEIPHWDKARSLASYRGSIYGALDSRDPQDARRAYLAEWRVSCPAADLNCDGIVSFFDVDVFVLALFDATAYAAAFPACDPLNGDLNADNLLTFADIDPFVACLLGTCP